MQKQQELQTINPCGQNGCDDCKVMQYTEEEQ